MEGQVAAAEVVSEAGLTCFVIGPIGNRHASSGSAERETYEGALRVMAEVIEPACERLGLFPVRADSLARAGEITEQVFRRLRDDDIVIADLTGANANVMYELGLRHTADKLTIQIGEYGRLPFDINTIRTIQFSRSPVGLLNARDELADVLGAGLAGEYDPVTSTRVWTETSPRLAASAQAEGEHLTDSGTTEPVTPEGEAPASSAADDRGFLEVMVEAEERQGDLVSALNAVGAQIIALGDLAEQATAETESSDAAGLGMRGRLQTATKYAAGVDRIAGALEGEVERYAGALSSVSAGNLALIEQLEEDPSQLEDAEAKAFGMTLRGLADASREGLASLAEMVATTKENAKLARVLRGPSEKLTAALSRFVDATGAIDEWDRRLQSLGVPTPPPDWDPDDNVTDEGDDPRAGTPPDSAGHEEGGEPSRTDPEP